MNGAESLVKTLLNAGVEVCFTNPGTSEMHFVTALDAVTGLRPVLGLFEGVATEAADGYARMAGKPAATLLHLGHSHPRGPPGHTGRIDTSRIVALRDRSKITSHILSAKIPKRLDILQTECEVIFEPTLNCSCLVPVR